MQRGPVQQGLDAQDRAETNEASDNDDGDSDGAQSASAYLERALDALRDEQPGFATAALKAALDTGDLNDAGRTLAYWYIYVAEQSQGHLLRAKDALADFVVVAQDVLALRNQVRFAESGGSDFIDRFDVVGRLARARALLNLAWARENQHFGRSAQAPVPVQSQAEVAYFLELAPSCARPLAPDLRYTQMAAQKGVSLHRIDFRCQNDTSDQSYFFEWRGTEPVDGKQNAYIWDIETTDDTNEAPGAAPAPR